MKFIKNIAIFLLHACFLLLVHIHGRALRFASSSSGEATHGIDGSSSLAAVVAASKSYANEDDAMTLLSAPHWNNDGSKNQ
jgi:hypothetical protein